MTLLALEAVPLDLVVQVLRHRLDQLAQLDLVDLQVRLGAVLEDVPLLLAVEAREVQQLEVPVELDLVLDGVDPLAIVGERLEEGGLVECDDVDEVECLDGEGARGVGEEADLAEVLLFLGG